jgi:hypothetical protein
VVLRASYMGCGGMLHVRGSVAQSRASEPEVRGGNSQPLSFTAWMALSQSWVSHGSVMDQSWASPGSVMGQSWASPGSVMDQSWASPGSVMGQSCPHIMS